MKQKIFLMAAACVLFSAVAAFAQTKTDFSGNWTLDVSKSQVKNIESGTMNVTQTDKDISYKTDFKRTPRPDNGGGQMSGGNAQGGGQGRRMGGGMMGGGQPAVYTLDGKEVTSQGGSSDRPFTSKMKSSWDGNKLDLTSTRTFNGPNGEITTTQKETWELADGGKTLKVHRESESPRGSQTSDYYYTKQ